MYSFRAPGVLLLLSLGPSLAAFVNHALPRPDAPDAVRPFLPAPAQSLSALVREVRRDGVIRRRYAQFFHVPGAEVVPYLDKNLLPTVLRRTGSYTVFFVSTVGKFYPTVMALSSGTPVFAGRDGVPVLLRGAGNPMTPFSMVEKTVPSAPPTEGGVQEQVVPAAGADIPVPASAPPPH